MADDSPAPFEGRPSNRSLSQRLDNQDKLLGEILTALKGDQLGNNGVLPRLYSVETDVRHPEGTVGKLQKQVESHDRKLWLVGSILTVVWAGLVAFKDYIFNKA